MSVSDSRTTKSETLEVCDGGSKAKLSAHRARTITLTCASGVIVIGGSSGSGVAARKGDLVQFTFSGRNGGLTVNARVA
jgi:hypothetical protein